MKPLKIKSSDVHGRLSPRKRTELQLARHHQLSPPECSRFSGSQWKRHLEKVPLMLANWQGWPRFWFLWKCRATLSVPSGFSLGLAWQRPRVTRGVSKWGFSSWEQACMAPSFPPRARFLEPRCTLLLRLKCFRGDFWKKYYIHKENSKTNSTRALRNLLTSEHNKVHSTQNGCDLRAGVRSCSNVQGAVTVRWNFYARWVNSCKNGYQTVFS